MRDAICIIFNSFNLFQKWMPFVFQTRSRLDEESEATLLTALTEILDSVDDETLSPFDTLPDTGLFSDQRLRDNSPVGKTKSGSVCVIQNQLRIKSNQLSYSETLCEYSPRCSWFDENQGYCFYFGFIWKSWWKWCQWEDVIVVL